MVGLCEDGNEPPGSLKVIVRKKLTSVRVSKQFTFLPLLALPYVSTILRYYEAYAENEKEIANAFASQFKSVQQNCNSNFITYDSNITDCLPLPKITSDDVTKAIKKLKPNKSKVDEPREFNLPTLPQRCITCVPDKLPRKYGVHSEECLPMRTRVKTITYVFVDINFDGQHGHGAFDLYCGMLPYATDDNKYPAYDLAAQNTVRKRFSEIKKAQLRFAFSIFSSTMKTSTYRSCNVYYYCDIRSPVHCRGYIASCEDMHLVALQCMLWNAVHSVTRSLTGAAVQCTSCHVETIEKPDND
ncbi:hypothetical protein ANN_16532 [Periplaneta americana]|uniref:Uncharacterized protein n=1 Tax=Periplaneta americana TaxID=6978 RepID=A0ABQ8SRZ9_PERAM|nr:hypothetical protein ANN_16532 [Periplaneta americana]